MIHHPGCPSCGCTMRLLRCIGSIRGNRTSRTSFLQCPLCGRIERHDEAWQTISAPTTGKLQPAFVAREARSA